VIKRGAEDFGAVFEEECQRSCRGLRLESQRHGESLNFGVIQAKKFIWRGGGDDAAGLEQDDARGQEKGFPEIGVTKTMVFPNGARER